MLKLDRWAFAKGWREDRRCLALVGLAFAVVLTGCDSTESAIRENEEAMARQQARMEKQSELERLIVAEARAWDTLEPLMREGANYQEDETFGYIGAAFVTERFYPERLIGTARSSNLGPYISVSQVFPGSPADLAGLMPGDRLLSINGTRMPRWDRAARFASVKVKRLFKPDELNVIEVSRKGKVFKAQVEARKAAYYAVAVSNERVSDMRADGEMVWLSLDLVEGVTDPNNFAYACAYVLAQNIMRHPEKRRKNQWMGQVLDIAAQTGGITTTGALGNFSGRRYHWAFSVEADLVALYLLSAVGYDVSAYPNFWQKQLVLSSKRGSLEPRDRERLEIMHQVIRSIDGKKARGAFIFPEEYLAGDTSEIQLKKFAASSDKNASMYSN
ncbi:hypothetical protein VDG1235_3398 [Verrucomicrobiia bacterium DG1235]|nr:hypothetical protein VDG1235_3398 [Verrucomicrobiae bacterium DG1235]